MLIEMDGREKTGQKKSSRKRAIHTKLRDDSELYQILVRRRKYLMK